MKFALGTAMLCAAIALAFVDLQVAQTVKLEHADYGAPFESPSLAVAANQLEQRVRVAAPLNNSWMTVGVTILDRDGRESAKLHFNLSYYHGSKEGREWRTGSRRETQFVILPAPGEYRIRLDVRAAAGTSAKPDFDRNAEPLTVEVLRDGMFGPQIHALAFIALSLGGAILLLRGAAGSTRQSVAAVPPGRIRPSTEDRMVFLDGLRGVACVSVLGCHLFVPELSAIASQLGDLAPAVVKSLMHHGHLGVEVFFVLSGFVIAYSLSRHRLNGSVALRFIARRSVRLDPPYLVAFLIASGVAALRFPGAFSDLSAWIGGLPGILANLFYLQDLLAYQSPVSVAWTLCLEIQFYLAYFGLAWAAQALARPRPLANDTELQRRSAVCLMVLAGPLMIWSMRAWILNHNDFTFTAAWFRFFLGAVTFWATQVRLLRWMPAGIAACIVLLSVRIADPRGGMAAATALLIFFASETGRLTRWLAGSAWQHLGRISYSLYLAHVVVGLPLMNWIWGFTPQSAPWAGLMAVVGIAASLGAAEWLHRLIEAPALRLSQRIRYS